MTRTIRDYVDDVLNAMSKARKYLQDVYLNNSGKIISMRLNNKIDLNESKKDQL